LEGTNDDYKKLSEYKNLTHKFDKMMKALYGQRGAQLDIDILASDEAQSFINAHAGILDSTFKQVKMTDKMRERLTRSNYIFSGIKTFHELNEAFPSLLDENGDRKPFERFLNDVRKIDETYNANYLHAEYNFVQASAEMAAKWEQYSEDGDRYLLQYRTAHDDKVRPEHAALDRITLPMSDPFWESYYPPNGWNCRCTVVQVRRGKYDETPHNEAMSRGEEVLNGEKLSIFRFNSGKQGKTMPDYNPYTIKRCNDCDVAKGGGIKLNFVPENELCAACRLIHQQQAQRNNQRLQRDEFNNVRQLAVDWANNNLHETIINGSRCKRTIMQTDDGHSIGVGKQFFTETAAKAMRDPEVTHLLKTATEFEKWLPNATRIRTEEGRHHGYGFSVYQVIYQGRTIEFKCKMTMGELLYTMKFI
jgi:SPP1 gp7 family putative phage head morphogenesis protein